MTSNGTGSSQSSNQLMNLNMHRAGPAGDDRSPRPPKLDTESRVLNIISKNTPVPKQNHPSQQPLSLPVVTSTLSADAKEFVPRSQAAFQQENYFGDTSANLSASAAEFYPDAADDYSYNSYYQNADYDPSYLVDGFGNMALAQTDFNVGSNSHVSTGDPILDKFNDTLYILNTHPANMEEYLRPICELIQRGQGKNTDVGNMVESLFEQGIQEANFRYTGARICQFLSTNLKDTPQFEGFQKTFMRRCQQEYLKRDDLRHGSPADQERLRGLAMFMGEIFLNVQVEHLDGSVSRLKFLPSILMDLAQCVMAEPNDLDIKCVCQLFKLSGALIEDEVKLKPEECMKFEDMFSVLQSLKENPNITEDAKFRLTNLVNLKDANWNRNMSSPPKKSHEFKSDQDSFQSQEPVFYNNMGQTCSRHEANLPEEEYNDNFHVLTEEEEEAFRQFEEESNKLVGDDTGYDSYNLGDAGEMGEEAEAAYEEFLQDQYNMLQRQQHQQINHHHNVYQHQPPQAPQNFNQQHHMSGVMSQPQGYLYNPQQPPPSHNFPPQPLYPQQDQFPSHMAPAMVPQQMHGMNLQQQQLQFQQQAQPPQQQQQQHQHPYNYPNQ